VRRGGRLETLDVFIGVIGFFSFAFLVVTVAAEFTGTDAIGWALTLLVFVLVLAGLLLVRRRMVASQGRAPDKERARP
jgi:hypothetical protein